MRISSIGLIAAVSLGLGGCAYNGLGVGVGSGYGYDDGYGYDRYGYDRYGYDRYAYGGGYNRYNPYGYNPYAYNAYGSPYGWYNGYYYPGTGGWVYDRDGRRREITRNEQAHFGRLTDAFRARVKQSNGSTTTTSSVRTPVTTATQGREPVRTRVIERRERPTTRSERSSAREERAKNDDTRIVRVRRARKDD